jgi:tetratricopeptide (TPR) repeat protein
LGVDTARAAASSAALYLLLSFGGATSSAEESVPVAINASKDVSVKTNLTNTRLEELEKKTDALDRKLDLGLESAKARIDVSANYVGIGQKQVDWWLQSISVGLAVMAFVFTGVGIFLPYLFTRNLRTEYESSIRGARYAEESARAAASLATQHAQAASEAKDQINHSQSQTNVSGSMSPNQIVELQTSPNQIAELQLKIADPNCSVENRLYYKTLLEQQNQNWEAAVKLAGEYVEKFPMGRSGYLRLGYSQSRLAQTRSSAERKRLFEEALASYEKELKNEPRNSSARSNIGWALSELADLESDQGKKKEMYEKASQSLVDAARLDPLNTDALNNHGWVYLEQAKAASDNEKRGKLLQEAAKYFEKALRINPKYEIARANLHLASAYANASL